MSSIEQFDAGSPFKLLIFDNESDNKEHLRLLDNYSKHHMVYRKPNVGRAQGGYQCAWWQNRNYDHYFFLHDDSFIVRDNWLRVGIEKIQDASLEPELADKDVEHWPVGKVGYCSYEWGDLFRYFRTGYPAIFRFLDKLLQTSTLLLDNDLMFQHIADDRILYSNACLTAIERIYNIEQFRDADGSPLLQEINNFFKEYYPGRGYIEPRSRYDKADWEGYQTWCEFMNDIMPMQRGFRTHNLIGNGYCQEELGYQSFWGNEYVAHFGAHNVFKRLADLCHVPENNIRQSYKSLNHLKLYASLIRNETDNVIKNTSRYSNA